MRELGIQKVMKIRLYDILTGEMKAELRKLNESTFTNGQETVFLTNGDGTNVASFDHTKSASIGGANSRISGDLMALQVGKDVLTLTNTKEIEYAETLTIASNACVTKYTATGTVGSEIKFAYLLDSNGNKTTTLTQAAVTASGKFAYASGTKTITTTALTDGQKIRVVYYPTVATAERIQNLTTNVSATCRVVAEVLFKDVCTDTAVYGQISAKKGHVSGEFEYSLSEGGSPAIHNFKVDLLENCGDNELWKIDIFDETGNIV
jgi:hypothetical protein